MVSLIKKVIVSMNLVILGLLSLTILVSYTFMPLNTGDVPVFFFSNPLLFLLALLFVVGVVVLRKLLEPIHEMHLFLGFALVYALLAVHFIFHITPDLKIDALSVQFFAHQMNAGNYLDLITPGGYMHRYPHQVGMAILDQFYLLFSDSPRVGYLFNTAFAIGSNFWLVKMVQAFFKNRLMTNYTTVLSFLFIPHFFFILFLYGSLPGLFFALLACYAFVCYISNRQRRYLAIMAISMSLAVLIRNNYAIVAIALVLLTVLDAFKQGGGLKRFVATGAVIAGLVLGQLGLKTYIQLQTGQSLPEGTPKIAYLVMGLQEFPGAPTRAGWFNYYTYTLWENSHYDVAVAKSQAKQDLQTRLGEFAADPLMAVEFFNRKIRNTWTESLFSGVVSGTYESVKPTDTGVWASLYRGEQPYIIAHYLSYFYLVVLYIFSFIGALGLWFKRQEGLQEWILVSPLIFLGGFVFHLFWESRSQYSHYYAYALVPLAVYGLALASDWLLEQWSLGESKRLFSRKRKTREIFYD